MTLSTLIITPVIPLLYPVPYRQRYAYAQLWTRFNLWWLEISCGLKYRVTGLENVPASACIIVAKHQSAWETLALQKFFPYQVWVLKKEVLWIPFFGWAMAAMEPIAINRSSARKALKQLICQGQQRLEDGRCVVIFPEGTRVPPGKKGKYGQGGAALAVQTGFPVVPVAHNAGEFWRRNDFIKRPGTIDVIIGKPIESVHKTTAELGRQVEDWIEYQMQTISITPYTAQPYQRKG